MGAALLLAAPATARNPEAKWDSQSLFMEGKRVIPATIEVHYSRIPADEWRSEIKKTKDGGITIIATYIFWNHVEEQEGI